MGWEGTMGRWRLRRACGAGDCGGEMLKMLCWFGAGRLAGVVGLGVGFWVRGFEHVDCPMWDKPRLGTKLRRRGLPMWCEHMQRAVF